MGDVKMKKNIGSAVGAIVAAIIVLCSGFFGGFTAGMSKSKNEFFSRLEEFLAPAVDTKVFMRLVEKDGEEPVEEKFNTLFSEVELAAGEVFENASFYFCDFSLLSDNEKLAVVSSDESIAEAKLQSVDELSVYLSITAKSQGTAEIFIAGEDGKRISQKICVFVSETPVSQTAEQTTAEYTLNKAANEETTTDKETVATTAEETKAETKSKAVKKTRLKAEKISLQLTADEKKTIVVFTADSEKTNLNNCRLKAVSSNKKVAKAKIEKIEKNGIRISITAVAAGKTVISVESADKTVYSETIEISVSGSEQETTEKQTEKEESVAAEEQTAKERSTTEKQTREVKTEETGDVVYRTPSGNCYHRKSCRYVKSNATALTVSEAKRSGLRACKVCIG